MKKNKWLLLVVFCCIAFHLNAQEFINNGLVKGLKKAGFDQIHILETQDDTVLFFENRNFRDPLIALKYIQKIEEESGFSVSGYVPLYLGSPLGRYNSETLDYRHLDQEERAFFQGVRGFTQGYRFNFRILPDFQGRFGYFEQPFETKTNVILDTRIYILKGLSLQGGILFPIYNNLDNQDNNIRLAPSHLNYFGQILPSQFINVSVGLFFGDRYGLDFSYRYTPLASRWSGGVNLGSTGYYYIPKAGLYTTPVEDLLGLVDVAYFIPRFNSTIQVTGGQFLAQDKGARLDFIRQYGSVDIGFFGTKTTLGTTAGFQLAFPLFPGKIFRSNSVELRTTETFRWEYSFSNEGAVGRRYRTGAERLDAALRQYNSAFLKGRH